MSEVESKAIASETNSVKPALLVVEDDPGLQRQLKWYFEDYEVLAASDGEAAMDALRRHRPAVVTLDLGLPPDPANASAGLELLQQVLDFESTTKVIVITGNEDRENAVRAVGLGAYDFYQKPVDLDLLGVQVARAFRMHALEMENAKLLSAQARSPLANIIAASATMEKICRQIEKVAPSHASVLLLGESGTGKEVLAKALHELSDRSEGPFVAINCAAIPDTLLESELFGFEKGAFTGASKMTPGKIEVAGGGTLFLDEIGDLPLALQAKLLRFLEERTIERLGGRKPIEVDVRVVSATHQDLHRQITEERFREDLFYRVSAITLNVPPLRERSEDAMVLANKFLEEHAKKAGRGKMRFSADAALAIQGYPWPGNVRELINRVTRAAIMGDGKIITVEDLDLPEGEYEPQVLDLRQVREAAEREAIVRALAATQNNVAKAAGLLGITRPTLYDLKSKYGMN